MVRAATANSVEQYIDPMVLADQVQQWLADISLRPTYRSLLIDTLTLPGNILSGDPNLRWSRLVDVCYRAAGGTTPDIVPVAAAVEVFMVALDLLDDEEDQELNPINSQWGTSRAINATTGLLLLSQWGLLRTTGGNDVLHILLSGGLQACGGQDADLAPPMASDCDLDASLEVTRDKSAMLVAAICQIGAYCAGADELTQLNYARFGLCFGMIRQLTNDIADTHPDASAKTDTMFNRPTLPLRYVALQRQAGNNHTIEMWENTPSYLTWTVADVYRRRMLDLIPQLTSISDHQAILTEIVPCLTKQEDLLSSQVGRHYNPATQSTRERHMSTG